ncbi:vesicle transport protein SFT2B [Entophlyctis helioformis]|nr:vesicle transport protein SFT2B [Entophlyctis helioformis]
MPLLPFTTSNAAGGEEMEKMCGDFNLTRTQRFYGFGICFGAGFLISFLSTFALFAGNVPLFAFFYTLGNVVSLIGTGFLIGFVSQLKKMFDPTRLVATIVFLSTVVLTLVCAFTIGIPILVIILCIAQYLALLWYSLSYIPFARDLVKNMFSGCFRS